MPHTDTETLYRWEEVPKEQMNELLDRRFIAGERVTLAQFVLRKGCVVPKHSHENEQFASVLEGALRFVLGDDEREVIVRSGEVLHLPAHLPHMAEALEDTVAVDVFSPPRQDWLEGGDDYLRGGGHGSGSQR